MVMLYGRETIWKKAEQGVFQRLTNVKTPPIQTGQNGASLVNVQSDVGRHKSQ